MVQNKTGICSEYVSGEGLIVVGYIPWDEYIKQKHDVHMQQVQQTKRKK